MKRKHSAGYFSGYDRGLECLLDLWPKIRQAVPDATLDIYYGWNTFDVMHSGKPKIMQWKVMINRKLKDLQAQGVTEWGRVSHKQLAKNMCETAVWLYPTEFEEINCITALKTAEAGMNQVCTKVAALAETAPKATFINCKEIYTCKKHQIEFIDKAIKALNRPVPSSPPALRYWPDVALRWDEVIKA